MNANDALELIKSLLTEGEHDGGIEVNAPSIEEGALLVDLNGAYFAISVEEF